MSHEGRMKRGAVFWSYRNRQDILPAGIIDNPEKMKDVNYFLENSKQEKEEPKEKRKKVKEEEDG